MASTCSKCGRELRPWPLNRGNLCSPARWVYCIRPAAMLPGKGARRRDVWAADLDVDHAPTRPVATTGAEQ